MPLGVAVVRPLSNDALMRAKVCPAVSAVGTVQVRGTEVAPAAKGEQTPSAAAKVLSRSKSTQPHTWPASDAPVKFALTV